jgi:type VI secretion system protein ImpL
MRWVAIVALALLLVVLWAAAFFLPEVLWLAVGVTLSLVAGAVVIALVRWLGARARAAALKRDAKPADRRPGLREIRAQMRRATASLRRSGRRARGVPLFGYIGASGSGKSTWLERSGLPFVQVDAAAAPPAGASGARAFCWWWSPEVMVLEAAGRLTSDRADRDEWIAVLDAVRGLRPERPLDGLLVAISAADILTLDDFELQRAAANLRAQIDEALGRLEMVLPVYCVITKADLIGGFVEFWSDLSRQDLQAVWGASFAIGDPRLREPARAIGSELEVLSERVHARVLDRIPAESDPERRARTMRFPIEFRALGARLCLFADGLLRADAAHESLVFRGFYLTSAIQVGLPAWRAQANRRVALPAATSQADQGEPKSYFIAGLLPSVALPDSGLATWSIAGARARLRRQLRAGLVALGLTVLVLGPAIVSYIHNARLASDAEATVRVLAKGEVSTAPGMGDDPSEDLLDMVERLAAEASSFGVPGWFGARAGQALSEPVRRVYVRRLHAWLLRHLQPELERQVEAVASAHALADLPASLDDRTPLRDSYDTVRLYATLVEPGGHIDPAWSPQRLARAWRALLPDAGAVAMERLTRHAANYLMALEADGSLAWPSSRALQGARDRLLRSSIDVRGLPYRRLLLFARNEPPIRASDIFNGASLEFLDSRGDVQVAGAYTVSGWARVREALQSSRPWPAEARIERWVLGDATVPANDAALRDQMRSQYFDEYTRHWFAFLDELRVKTPANVSAARAELAAFKEPDGFYSALFKQFKQNAIHEEPTLLATAVSGLASKLPWAKSDPEAGAVSVPPTPVDKSFRPLLLFSGDLVGDRGADGPAPLEKYRLILAKLKAALDAPSDQPNPDVQTQFSEAGTGVRALLDGVDEPMRSRLCRLLMPPVMGGVQVQRQGFVGSLSDAWKAGVWTAWDGKLSGRFPFTKTAGETTANFADFTAFFKPNDGLLWGFVHAALAGWVERTGSGDYAPKKGADPLSLELFGCLTVAQEITDAFFREGDDPGLKLSVQADWSAPDVSAVRISFGAKETPLPRAQWSPAMRWLGEDAKLEWVQGGRPTQELGRHAFSLLDLFHQLGGLRPAGGGTYVADFPPLVLKLRPEGKVDALRSDFFSRLRCPREIGGPAGGAMVGPAHLSYCP